VAQVSTNVQNPFAVPLADVVEAVRAQAGPLGASVAAAELVGLAPAAALDGFPPDVELRGFNEDRHILENRMPARRV
jgi:glutamate formiminotransferase